MNILLALILVLSGTSLLFICNRAHARARSVAQRAGFVANPLLRGLDTSRNLRRALQADQPPDQQAETESQLRQLRRTWLWQGLALLMLFSGGYLAVTGV